MGEIAVYLLFMMVSIACIGVLRDWKNMGEVVKDAMRIAELEKGRGKGAEKLAKVMNLMNAPWYFRLIPPLLDFTVNYFVKKNINDVNWLRNIVDQTAGIAVDSLGKIVHEKTGDSSVKIIGADIKKEIKEKGSVEAFAEY